MLKLSVFYGGTIKEVYSLYFWCKMTCSVTQSLK